MWNIADEEQTEMQSQWFETAWLCEHYETMFVSLSDVAVRGREVRGLFLEIAERLDIESAKSEVDLIDMRQR